MEASALMKGLLCSIGLLALSAGAAIAQPVECNLSTSDGTPFPVPFFFELDQRNRRAVLRGGAVFALEVEEQRYRLTRQEPDGTTRVFVINRDTGFGAWGLTGGARLMSVLLRCFRAPPRL